MNKKNHTRSALFTSIISLLLCVSMLVGTTFAWFTDNVTSANNIIKSGNLDVTLEYWDGNSWEDVEDASDILAGNLWEPGYVDVAYLRLKNAGSLALKYQLGVNIVSETEGKNQKEETFKLSDYIYFDVVEGVNGETGAYANRAAALAVATENTKISTGYSKAGALEAGSGYVYLAMVVHMPTTVGNVANHNGKNVPQIDLGINVFATQFTSESDSFDENYDGGAKWIDDASIGWYMEGLETGEYVIGSAEDLAGLAAIVNGTATSETATYSARATTIQDDFAGKTITLASNIDLAGKAWTPIGSFDYDRDAMSYANLVTFKGTFDGQGYAISNLKINTPATEGAGLFASVEAATIKNVTVHNVDIVAGSHAAAIVGRAHTYGKTTTITNCHVTGNISIKIDWAYAGAIIAKANTLNISNCSVMPAATGKIVAANRNAVGSVVGWVEQPSTIANCKAENMELTGWANIGAINGFISQGSTMDSCSAKNIVITKTRVDGIASVGMAAGGWCYSATQAITITNNAFDNITFNGTYVANAGADLLYGSEFYGATTTNFVTDNNTVSNITNENLVEVDKVSDGVLQKTDGTYVIYTAAGLSSLGGTKVNGTYMLAADIDMTGMEMKPIQVANNESLVFIGNGHTISNVTIVAAKANGMTGAGNEVAGLFDVTANASANLTVSDLTIKNANVACSGYAAAIVGYANSSTDVITLNNVDVIGATITSDSVAALVGYTVGPLTLTDCDVSGLTLTGEEGRPEKVGAYVGTANTATCAVEVVNCTNTTTYRDYGRVINGATWNGGIPVATTEALISTIKAAPKGEVTTIYLADDTYAENIDITVAALGKSGGDVVIKALNGATPVITGTVTLGYREQGIAAAMYDANVTFEGITFDHAEAAKHSISVGDVKSLTLKNCTIIGDGEYGISSDRGNATGTSKIVGCTFKNAAMQLLGNFATGLVIDDCTFNNSRINVQAGNGVTVQNCKFNNTLTAANVGDSFYAIRSNSTPITVKNCEINIDSELTEVATAQAKWYLLANRGTTNWTVENVEITLTDAALAQTELDITACTSTGKINTTNLTVNGVVQ